MRRRAKAMRRRTWTSELARASARRPGRVLSLWVAAVIAAIVAIGGWLGAALTSDDDFTGMPESRRAQALIDQTFPPRSGGFHADEAVIVRSRAATVDDAAF